MDPSKGIQAKGTERRDMSGKMEGSERWELIVYKIPYRRARAWPSGCIGRVRARLKESCIQGN